MEKEEIWRFVRDHYAGKLSTEKRQQLLAYLELLSAEELEALYPLSEWEELQRSLVPDSSIAEAAYQQHKLLRKAEKKGRQGPFFYSTRFWVRAACIIGIVSLGGYLIIRVTGIKGPKGNSQQVTQLYKTVVVPEGRQVAVSLPDGSQMMVGGGSRLRVPEAFTGQQREIFLEGGQAFFKVARDIKRPFIIHTTKLDIQVLGTSFSIRDYPDEAKGSVIVRTGKVAVSPSLKKDSAVYLLPGEQVELNKAEGQLLQSVADTLTAFGWMNRQYIFRSRTFKEITQVLSHDYGVRFVISSEELAKRKISASFRQQTIEEIVAQLSVISALDYTIEAKTITIR